MSVESLSKALHVPGLTTIERIVLVGIANHDGDGGAWPSIATLASYACCTPRHVQRTIAALASRGIVQVHKQAGGSASTPADRRPNLFTIHWPVDNPVDGVTPRSPRDERGDTQVTRGVTPTSPEPSLEPSSLTSEHTFTRAELERAFDRKRKATPHLRQRILDRTRASTLTDMRPQPPIDIAVGVLFGEEHSLTYWLAEQHTPVIDDPVPMSREERERLVESNRLTSGDKPGTVEP